jgi:ribosomal protein S6--L-glutamate ligase
MKRASLSAAEIPLPPLTIGRREFLSFVDWPVPRIKAKIDTGAYSSALDMVGYELHERAEGRFVARIRLALSRKHPERIVEVEAPVTRMTVVRNSSGVPEQRPVIETRVKLGPIMKKVQITLTRRHGMRFRMLLGRQAIAGGFVVDVTKKYLLG